MSTFSLYSKRFVSWIFTMLLLVVIVSLIRNAWGLWSLRSRVTDAENELKIQEEKKEKVEALYQENESAFVKEREIRDKLNLALPGEELVIVPEELRSTPLHQDFSGQAEQPFKDVPNWMKWWKLIVVGIE
jgi:biopolymer transport protein ExbB/TolQ